MRLSPQVTYSHYPLGTIVHSGIARLQVAGSELVRQLALADVSMHVDGHLHSLFGTRLHTLYEKPLLPGERATQRRTPVYLAELEASTVVACWLT